MRRYDFLNKEETFEALNNLRNAFLAAKDGNEVEDIINGVLTFDERMKIGRRIQVAQMLTSGFNHEEIMETLHVGKGTVTFAGKLLNRHPNCYELINQREKLINQEYSKKSVVNTGGSLKVYKSKQYTGFKRSDVNR